jgi:hypothetical protein
MKPKFPRLLTLLLAAILFPGCAVMAKTYFDGLYGEASVIERTVSTDSYHEPEFYQDIKPIVDSRCVVCHGCYDAPCQLKMTSFESLDRGANSSKVYDGTRLLAANLTRVFIDGGTTEDWRKEGFYPVLNERDQVSEANTRASLVYRMLELKKEHPLPPGDILPDSFDFSLNRDQQCTKIEEFSGFEQEFPLWGMPYGLPAIDQEQSDIIVQWLKTGAKARFPGKRPTQHPLEVDRWEAFFNGPSLKEQLMSRYIYEHLFLANIYFSTSSSALGEDREFFKLVRSTKPSGQAVDIIPSRRPFDSPGGEFYYRLQRVKSTVLAKQNMPYLLDEKRLKYWKQLFLETNYTVSKLPSYQPSTASNPFETFRDIPADVRYKFMLDEAQFTIMGFIKGPVCRGQVALSVIHDHFWVLFVDPKTESKYITDEFLAKEAKNLRLPAEKESNVFTPLSSWMEYSRLEKKYIKAKEKQLRRKLLKEEKLHLDFLWNGNGSNKNAALTVFRHFDSSTVIKGLVGDTPKTAWVIGYPLLERIHYLLVAGFDVYGNVGHQLLTRLYMDFLRMEGESNFLRLLPNETALAELDFWYRGEDSQVDTYLKEMNTRKFESTDIHFETENPKKELFNLVLDYFGETVVAKDLINGRPSLPDVEEYQQLFQELSKIKGAPLEFLPEQAVVKLVLKNGEKKLVSLIRNKSHSNVSHLFGEQYRLIPEEQTLSVVEGIVGAYPNVFFDLYELDLESFVEMVGGMQSEKDYQRLLTRYGVRRTNKDFWSYSDAIHDIYMQQYPIEAGFLDYNRIENR